MVQELYSAGGGEGPLEIAFSSGCACLTAASLTGAASVVLEAPHSLNRRTELRDDMKRLEGPPAFYYCISLLYG